MIGSDMGHESRTSGSGNNAKGPLKTHPKNSKGGSHPRIQEKLCFSMVFCGLFGAGGKAGIVEQHGIDRVLRVDGLDDHDASEKFSLDIPAGAEGGEKLRLNLGGKEFDVLLPHDIKVCEKVVILAPIKK